MCVLVRSVCCTEKHFDRRIGCSHRDSQSKQGKTRNRLIKKAKTNGDELGFLW